MCRVKLAIIISRFAIGGAENMVYELIKGIDHSKFDVHVICYMSRCNTTLEMKAERICPIYYLDISERIGFREVKKVFDALERVNPDVVHSHLGGVVFGAIWTMFRRKPFVVTIHTKPENEFTRKIRLILKCRMLMDRWTLTAVSPENEKLVKRFYKIKKDERCLCIANGVDVNRFYRKEHECFTIINLARQDENKNQAAILRSFSKIYQIDRNARLVLAGDGPMHQNLVELANELRIQDVVLFPGMVSNTEDYYAVSDVYVQSSHREAMPLSVLEAMAAGLPIVSTDVGGLRDVVQGNGELVPDNDEQALFEAILRINMFTNQERDVLGETSRKLVSKYSSDNMAKQYMDLYKKINGGAN